MNAPEISILIVSYNTADFIELSLEALKKLTTRPYRVYVLDNNSRIEDYRRLLKIASRHPEMELERNETPLRGSEAHGFGMNHLVKKVVTPYFSILDADATWLIKDWDGILIRQIDEKVKVIGTASPIVRPIEFPETFCILFETASFRRLGIDFTPKDIARFEDTGWDMAIKYPAAGLAGKIIEMKNTRTWKEGPFRELITAEFYLDGDYSKIFASHFSRGSSLGVEKYRTGLFKLMHRVPVLGRWFLERKGRAEKAKWLKICRQIIDQQSFSNSTSIP